MLISRLPVFVLAVATLVISGCGGPQRAAAPAEDIKFPTKIPVLTTSEGQDVAVAKKSGVEVRLSPDAFKKSTETYIVRFQEGLNLLVLNNRKSYDIERAAVTMFTRKRLEFTATMINQSANVLRLKDAAIVVSSTSTRRTSPNCSRSSSRPARRSRSPFRGRRRAR